MADVINSTLECRDCHWIWHSKASIKDIVVRKKGDKTPRSFTCPLCEHHDISVRVGYNVNDLIEQFHWRVTTFEPSHVVEKILQDNKEKLMLEFYL